MGRLAWENPKASQGPYEGKRETGEPGEELDEGDGGCNDAGHGAKECGRPLGAGKGNETGAVRAPRRNTACGHFHVRLAKPAVNF